MPDTLIKMKTGTITKLEQKDGSGNPVVPIEQGTVYFAVDATNEYGKIVFDNASNQRIVMSTRAETADHALTADNAGSADAVAWGNIVGKPNNFTPSTHTHTTSLVSGGTATVNLAANTAYTLTTGGTSVIFKTPTDTWRGIQDNLTSTATDQSLSANQGRLLANGSARDSTKLPLAGGTMTGALTFANNTKNVVGDDCAMGDFNVAGTLGFQGQNGTTALALIKQGETWSTSANYAKITYDGSTVSFNKTITGTLSGNASTATKWETGRTLTIGSTGKTVDGSGNVSWSLSEIGAAAANHSHNKDTISSVYEANLVWGGKNFTASYGCIDAAMVDDLGANRLMFAKAAGITIEYSRDNGVTWLDYGATDVQKVGLFSVGNWFYIGKADSTNKATEHGTDYQLRVTLSTGAASIYTALNKFIFNVSTNGSSNCTVTIDRALESTPTTFVNVANNVPVSGWNGYNVVNTNEIVTYGNTASSQNGRIRFTFKANGGNTNYAGLGINQIMGFGGVGWTTPSIMAKTGHLYAYDANQNATFPAQVTATQFNGALSGNASTATKLATARSINGTNFDGSANITTANWGTARTITIGTTGKSVNGSANVIWTHAEIGAIVSNAITNGTTDGPTLTTTVNGVAGTAVTIPLNTKDNAGVVPRGNGFANCTWKTDASGVPGWREDASAAPIFENVTLLASGWNTTTKTYTINSVNATADSIQICSLPDYTYASSDEMDALGSAKIVDGGQGAGYFILKALGDVPTIDIDILVLYQYSTDSTLSSLQSAAASANAAAVSAAQAAASAKVQRKTVTFSSVTSDTSISPYKYKYEVAWTGVTSNDWVDASGITDQDWAIESATNKVILRFTNNISTSKTVTCYWATTEAS